jgi:hypothetical protein
MENPTEEISEASNINNPIVDTSNETHADTETAPVENGESSESANTESAENSSSNNNNKKANVIEDDGPPVLPHGRFWLHDNRDGLIVEDRPVVDKSPAVWSHDKFLEQENGGNRKRNQRKNNQNRQNNNSDNDNNNQQGQASRNQNGRRKKQTRIPTSEWPKY